MTAAGTDVRRRGWNGSSVEQLVLGAAGIATVFVAWWVGAAATSFIPAMGEVFEAAPDFASDPAVPTAIGETSVRVLGALAIAYAIGLAAAMVMERRGFWSRLVSAYVTFAAGVPSTIAALLALYIFQRSPVAVYVVVAFITFPFVAVILRQGLSGLDRKLNEMGELYGVRGLDRMRTVVLPQLTPFLFSAFRNEYAHAWKVVVLAELFAVNSGMGWEFSTAFDNFLLVDVLLWLLVFMALLLGGEYLVIRPLERFALRWRISA